MHSTNIKLNLDVIKNAFPSRGTFNILRRECIKIKGTIIVYALSQKWRLMVIGFGRTQ